MLISTAIIISTVVGVILYLINQIKTLVKNYVHLTKLPGPERKNWVLGSVYLLQETPDIVFNKLREFAKDFYPIYQLHAINTIGVTILSPEDCELIMSNPLHMKKGQIYDLVHNWLRDGLLTSTGQKWQLRRKILTPAFHFNTLQQFILVFNEESEKLVEVLKDECKKNYTNITPIITQFTLKTITETAMGCKLNFNTKKEKDYKQAVYDIGQILIYRLFHPWFLLKIFNYFSPYFFQEMNVVRTLHNFTKEVIKEREKNFKDVELPKEEHDVYKGKRRLAMLDLLLSVKNKEGLIDDKGIQEEVDTFMFEGHDTTAVALGFILLLLANHKEAQEQIVEEMLEVLGDLHKKPDYNDFQALKFMERCIKESLRLYPSVHFITRTTGGDLVTHTGEVIPKDTMLIIHIYDLHHNPNIYPDPEKFDPDRFLPENVQKRHPFAYLPFSAGLRNCIGQKFAMLELKAALCAILGNFVLEPIDTPESIVLVIDIVLRTKEGIKIKFMPRN